MVRRKRLLPVFVLVAGLLSGAAEAAPLKIVGFEDMSCKTWVRSRDDPEMRSQLIAWVRGVLTGHNYANQGQQVSAISNGTVEQYVTRYCSEKPLGMISDAAFRMTDQFSGRNQPILK